MSVTADPLAPLAELPGVREAVAGVQHALARVHEHPTNRRGWAVSAAEAGLRAARASAGLDGAALRLPAEGPGGGPVDGPVDVRVDGAADAPADPVLAGALRVAGELGRLLPIWRSAPLQALARLHLLAAADLVPAADRGELLGRPRPDRQVSDRLNILSTIVTQSSQIHGVVLTSVVHGELLVLAPFDTANGVVTRAAARLTAVSSGLDQKGLAVPEVGHLRAGAAYRLAATEFGSGSPDGLAHWLLHCCDAWRAGAQEGLSIADSRRT